MKHIKLLLLAVLLFSAGSVQRVSAQMMSIKTNALYWANATPNLSLEFVTTRRTSLEASAFYSLPKTTFKFTTRGASLEYRYWLAGRQFVRSFVGVAAQGGMYRSEFRGYSHHGETGALGLTIGYVLPLARRWNLEFGGGFGFWIYRERRYRLEDTGNKSAYNQHGLRFAPLKLGISVGYTL